MRSVVVNEVVATKNSISSNSGLATGFLKTLAVPIRQNGAGFILGIASGHQRCRSPIVECVRGRQLGLVDGIGQLGCQAACRSYR
jgi:hypothetical protein